MKVATILLIFLIITSFSAPLLTSIVENITLPVVKVKHNFALLIGNIIGTLGDGDEISDPFIFPT